VSNKICPSCAISASNPQTINPKGKYASRNLQEKQKRNDSPGGIFEPGQTERDGMTQGLKTADLRSGAPFFGPKKCILQEREK
jgi:hypothetical protein